MDTHELIFKKYRRLGYSVNRAFDMATSLCLSSVVWEESKHPRDHGKFSSKSGGPGVISKNQKVKKRTKSQRNLHAFLKTVGIGIVGASASYAAGAAGAPVLAFALGLTTNAYLAYKIIKAIPTASSFVIKHIL